MAIHLVRASSQGLKLTGQTIVLPVSFGCWVRTVTTAIGQNIIALGEGAGTLGWIMFQTSSGGAGFALDYNPPGSQASSAGGPTLNVWCYLVGRLITTTNRRLESLRETGVVTHGQGTGSITTGTITTLSIGCLSATTDTSFFNGDIAEFFYCNGDIDPTNSGIALTDDFVRNLAYNGPFSFPHIVPLIQEYRSFRSMTTGIATNRPYDYQPNEVYQKGGQRLWTTVGAPTLIDHPPLAGNYVRPGQNLRNGIFA